MQILLLGYGAAINSSIMSNSLLINDNILIETPPYLNTKLIEQNINIEKIDNIFISHLHADHYFGLPFILIELFRRKNKNNINIWGPPKLFNNTVELLQLAFPNKDYINILKTNNIVFHELSHKKIVNLGNGISVTPILVKHTIKTFGFNIRLNYKNILYSSDTEICNEVVQAINKCDIALLDSTTEYDAIKGHMSFKQILEIAKKNEEKIFYAIHRSNYKIYNKMNNLIVPNTTPYKII